MQDHEHVRVLKEALARRLDEDLAADDDADLDDDEDYEDEDEEEVEKKTASDTRSPPRRGESTSRRA